MIIVIIIIIIIIVIVIVIIITTTISRPSWAMARPESGTEAAEHAASCAGSAEVEQVARMDPERR